MKFVLFVIPINGKIKVNRTYYKICLITFYMEEKFKMIY